MPDVCFLGFHLTFGSLMGMSPLPGGFPGFPVSASFPEAYAVPAAS